MDFDILLTRLHSGKLLLVLQGLDNPPHMPVLLQNCRIPRLVESIHFIQRIFIQMVKQMLRPLALQLWQIQWVNNNENIVLAG